MASLLRKMIEPGVLVAGIVACGASGAAPATPSPDASVSDSSVTNLGIIHVSTGGGGTQISAPGANLGGALPMDASEEAGTLDATSSAILDANLEIEGGDGAVVCGADYVPEGCGTGTPQPTCDLRVNTCCVNASLEARCVSKAAGCLSSEATIGCTQACECPGGQVCCGVYLSLMGVVVSECQQVPAGGVCQPSPQTNTQVAAQLCKTQGECTAVDAGCVNQTCIYGINVDVCGVQSEAPFNCTATDAGL